MGSIGLFFTAFLLFCRFLPVLAMSELKGVLSYGRPPRPKADSATPEKGEEELASIGSQPERPVS